MPLTPLIVGRKYVWGIDKMFEVILVSKERWPLISRYEIVKTSDGKYDNATKVASLFTYPIIA